MENMPGTPRARTASPGVKSEYMSSTPRHTISGQMRLNEQDDFTRCPIKVGERLILTREDRSKYKYDRANKGWRGPVHSAPSWQTNHRYPDAKAATMLISLRNGKQNQAKETAMSHTRTQSKERSSPVGIFDEDIGEDVLSLSEFPAKETPTIRQPFTFGNGKYVNWRQPELLQTERVKTFAFSKPVFDNNDEIAASNLQAVMLKKVIDQKDVDLVMLRGQLTKAHEEICRLSRDLDGFRCKNYLQLVKENAYFKEQVGRLRRENMKLLGARLQKSNTSLKRMEETEQLERRHVGSRNRSRGRTIGFLML